MSNLTPPPPPPRRGPPPAPDKGRKGKAPASRSNSSGIAPFLRSQFAQENVIFTPSAATKTNHEAMCPYSAERGEEVTSRERPPSYAKGGIVKKTGLAKVHKGELVVPVKNAMKVKAMMKKAGMGCGCGCKGKK